LQTSIAHASLIVAVFAASLGQVRAETPDFGLCVAELQKVARADGISAEVVEQTLGNVSYVERVIELDRRQPEFTQTFSDYYNGRVTGERVASGRVLLQRHGELLHRVLRDTGVPPHYLIAFWGLETNFGSYFGNMSVPDSLATLACDERRSAFFTMELMAALHIIDAGDISAERMEGSWAGAMGHVQFMPSVFLRFAVDADHDGRRDLWGSIPDAMTSGGNFLKHLGWVRGLRWGREVLLPEGFDYARANRSNTQALHQWAEWGLTNAFGDPLPRLDVRASLLVPAGHRGPAFLTYQNFDVIKGWNRSEFYAIAVGRLADRIAGAGTLERPPLADESRLPIADVTALQRQLNELGFEAGEPDGVLGPATREALSRFQQANGMTADGYADQGAVEAVRLAVRPGN
jgi:membrane-bound lytic murein transglycosylase B